MTAQLWVVRAGKNARHVDEFFTNDYIAVDFTDLAPDDLSTTTDAAVRARATDPRLRIFANQVGNFAYHMAVGDMVVVPRVTNKHRDYLVAEVTGPYQHQDPAPESGPHQRSVRWLGRFDREALSQDTINTLGAILTLFRPAAVEAELRGLLTGLAPIGSAASPPPPVPAQLGDDRSPPGSDESMQHDEGLVYRPTTIAWKAAGSNPRLTVTSRGFCCSSASISR